VPRYKDPADAIIGLTKSATKIWTKQRRAEERDRNARANRKYRMIKSERVTIRDAAFQVMEEAYQKASNNGKLPVNPRQIYYAARRYILLATGRDELQSGYFLQTLLRDYMDEYDCSDWDIIWDARGHFTEPHTRRIVPLGTLQVRQYLGVRPPLGPAIEIKSNQLYPTRGPENRYRSVLFIEKEGFDPLLESSRLAERFDVGITSTKGMSTSAARELLDELVQRGVERVMVLHDLDLSGFSILGTLGTSSTVYWYRNKIPIIDIGLRLADVGRLNLLAEPCGNDKDWEKVKLTLRRHGATMEEIAFLQKERVELNALTSTDFIRFIEDKFQQYGVEKLVPDDEVMRRHARRVIEQCLTVKVMDESKKRIAKEAALIPLPENLQQQVEARLADNPAQSWDDAVALVIEADLGCLEDEGAH
jgi:hypothetical protein